ncbi:hypothetical protein [Paenarthrobacter aurescens]|uniref:hypothetical protein n=1 Tax=Paenarthrobacter aurescens TaxID=43663 RepID=UPI001EE39652|nr:hypothetical protein [Paenarthrobacter aurescens]
MSLASLLTNLIQSMGTVWDLFRHYWILAKLLITVVASFLLLVHMQPVSHAADLVSANASAVPDFGGLKVQLAADAGAALAVLLVAVVLSVFKPQGPGPATGGENSRSNAQPRCCKPRRGAAPAAWLSPY